MGGGAPEDCFGDTTTVRDTVGLPVDEHPRPVGAPGESCALLARRAGDCVGRAP
jgi:hypothetical protein